MQARAVHTRQKIRDTAVKLFAGNGYLETDVKAIARAADLTPGAFYYHFESKEALAIDLIAEGWSRLWRLIGDRLDANEPGLGSVIATTLEQAQLFVTDELVCVAVQLSQAFGHLSMQGRRDIQQQFDSFVDKIAGNVLSTDIRDGVTPHDVAELIWIMLQGSVLDPVNSSVPRAVKNWDILLRAIVPAESLPRYEQVLANSVR